MQAGVREFMQHVVAAGFSSAVAYYNDVAKGMSIPIRGDAKGRELWEGMNTPAELEELAAAHASYQRLSST